MVFGRRVEQTGAVFTVLQRVRDAQDEDERNRLLVSAWTVGATAQELHDATGLPGAELRSILEAAGVDVGNRRRGWK